MLHSARPRVDCNLSWYSLSFLPSKPLSTHYHLKRFCPEVDKSWLILLCKYSSRYKYSSIVRPIMFGTSTRPTYDPKQALEVFFHTPWQFYSDEDISRLGGILEDNGMREWSRAPRLYFVLRGVGQQRLISAFLELGIDDGSLPMQESALQSTSLVLSPAIINDFLRCQEQIVKHEDAVYEDKLDAYFPPARNIKKHPLEDIDFQQISRLLRFSGKADAGETPKLYYILRTIQELDRLPFLHAKGFNDLWFPFPQSSLARSFFQNSSSPRAFTQAQQHVCSSRWAEDVHLNFTRDDDEYLDKLKDLGSGGTGFVDHVWCPSFRKNYARKVITRSPEGLRIFAKEIKMLKAVNHHHCVSLIGSYTDTRVIAMLSEPVADMNLGTFLDATPIPTDRKDLLQTSFGCLSVALAYLHENGIRHKDIKPQNILIHINTLLLTDFGLSADTISDSTSLASNTPRYCPPEVDDGFRRDEASDVWSMGCVFYEIISALRGSSMAEMKTFFRKTGSRRLNFKDNPDAISLWLLAEVDPPAALGQMATTAMSLVSIMLSFAPEERPSSSSLVQSFGNDYVPSAFYNRCCKQQLLAAASNSLRPRPHDFLKPAAAQQYSLPLHSSLMASPQLTASQKSAPSSSFSSSLHPRSPSPLHSSATPPHPKSPYTSTDPPPNNPDYSSLPPSSPASQRSSSTPHSYTTAAPSPSISGDDTRRILPYHSLVHEPKGTSLSQESKWTSPSSIRIDSSADSHETMLEARKLSKQHSDTFTSPANLVTSYNDVGRKKEALDLREKRLEVQRRTLGEEHPDTLNSMADLAVSYYDVGRKEEAMQLNEKTLKLRRRTLNEEHPDTLNSMADLAVSYYDVGRKEEAMQLNEKTLEVRRRTLGEEHPDTLNSMASLAFSYYYAGWKEEAIHLDEKTLEVRRRILGEEHSDTLNSMTDLAISYYHTGRKKEALQLEEKTLEVRRRKEHSDTLTSMTDLVISHDNVGRKKEALRGEKSSQKRTQYYS